MSEILQEDEPQTFVEAALTLGGKSEEEARKTGSLDRADEQVEALFAPRYQTSQSPVHRAVWDREFPADVYPWMLTSGTTTRSDRSVLPCSIARIMPAVFAA